MRAGERLACSMSLVVAGVLLARGFIGLTPGRPVYVVLGGLLVATALVGLGLDHVSVRNGRTSPDELLNTELNRCRRHGHFLTMLSIPCRPRDGERVVTRLRTTDYAWRHNGYLIALLMETDRAGSARFVARIGDLVDPASVRAATFPQDALTTDELYRLTAPTTPAVIRRAIGRGRAPREPAALADPEAVGR